MPPPPSRTSTVADFLAEDGALLAAGATAVQARVVASPAISFGVGAPKVSRAAKVARREGLPILHRHTGGSGILHRPGDLLWSIVLPRNDPRVGPDFSSAYGRLGAGLVLLLGELGHDARWSDPPGLSEELCLLGGRGRVLEVDGRVLGGAAQHLTSAGLLHHGVLAVGLDRALVTRVFGISEAIARDRLTSVDELGAPVDPAALADRLVEILGALTGARSRT